MLVDKGYTSRGVSIYEKIAAALKQILGFVSQLWQKTLRVHDLPSESLTGLHLSTLLTLLESRV